MKRGISIFQWSSLYLTDPLHHQRHRSDQVVLIQQRFNHKLKRLRRVEHVDELLPERDVASCCPSLMPGAQCSRHQVCRNPHFPADQMLHTAYRSSGKLIPPTSQAIHRTGKKFFLMGIVTRGSLGPGT